RYWVKNLNDRIMNSKILLPFLALLVICCANKAQVAENEPDFEKGYYTRVEASQGSSALRPRGMPLDEVPLQHTWKPHQLRDPRSGLVVSSSLYPSNWKVISKAIYTTDQKIPTFLIQAEGPHNFMAFNTPTTFRVSYQNPQTAQYMAQVGLGEMIRLLSSGPWTLIGSGNGSGYWETWNTGFPRYRRPPLSSIGPFGIRSRKMLGP